jgi:Na+/melibiose symporter-like transporter
MRESLIPPAFRHRRFLLLWLGLLVSITGTQMQSAAILWHINELTGLPIALGGVGLARIGPIIAFSLVAGAVADTLNRRRLILLTQTLLAMLAGLLGWLTLNGRNTVWAIYGITALAAGVAAFDLPARQDLTNAFSLSSIAFQPAPSRAPQRAAGPWRAWESAGCVASTPPPSWR